MKKQLEFLQAQFQTLTTIWSLQFFNEKTHITLTICIRYEVET